MKFERKLFFAAFAVCALHNVTTAYAVTWQEQAERLQKVSATLLDNVPTGEPVTEETAIELRAVVSFLPKVNPTVGGKTEKVPSAPVHAVPSLQFNKQVLVQKPLRVGLQAWGGYLMPGGEALFGIKAKLSQYAFGAAAAMTYELGNNEIFWNMGFQNTGATLKGAITAADASDSFQVQTLQFYAAPGFRMPSLGIWTNLMLGMKATTSEFEIASDATKYKFADTLSDATMPFFTQLSIGWRHTSGIELGFAELVVPSRLTMPRAILSYQYAFH